MKKSLTSRFLAGALLACAASAMAAPVTFNVTSANLSLGAGYGDDANENRGTLLDLWFTTAFSAQNCALASVVGDSCTFLVGTLDFRESNGSDGILADETDLLGVTATLTFSNPLGGSTQALTTTGVATAGPINGGANDSDNNGGVDYSLAWAALTDIDLGTGGRFNISLNPITFSATNDWANLSATVTLRALPLTTQLGAVPEPASLALLATALTLAGLATRRRRDSGA